MCHDSEDEHFLAGRQNSGYQAKFVPPDVKDYAGANQAGSGEACFYIGPGLPRDGFMIDMGVPSPQRTFRQFLTGHFPKLSQS